MKIKYHNEVIMIKECKSFFDRFMGFMGKRNFNYGLLFNHCSSIHTFFMKENIDVLMLDNDDNILYIYENLKKNKVLLPKKNVCKVIELPCNHYKFKLNEKIVILDD